MSLPAQVGLPPTSEILRQANVPILMYHRVATDGPMELGRFRIDPALFDEQLSALKQVGFTSVDLRDWVGALSRSEALPGKPILFTFDDGYRDFLTHALPALRKHSLAANVFLVADRIGGLADWDTHYGEVAPLMSWEELRALGKEEVELGCHSLNHRPMTEINQADLLTETGRAREILEDGLGRAVTHFAYPYGAENVFVRNSVAFLGFQSGVTCQPDISRLGNDPMRLPRIEVPGTCTPEDLLSKLGHS